jgi:exodeoxyribonuclease VII small subunit
MPKARPSISDASSEPSPVVSPESLPGSFEEAMAELEQMVTRLESGELPLDQLLTHYQRGAALLQHCREKLQAVEDQIKVLDDGVLKPWKPS